MRINDVQLGANQPIRKPQFAQTLGDAFIEGVGPVVFSRGASFADMPIRVFVKSPIAIAGNAALSQAANEALVRWLEELGRNGDVQPVYVRWSDSRALPQDGWWYLSDVRPDYTFSSAGAIPVDMTFRQRGQAGSPVSTSWGGGALKSVYTAVPVNLLSLPQNASGIITGVRTGAEGSYPYVTNPPGPGSVGYLPSSTIDDSFKAACSAYDALLGLSTNPVPVAGLAVNANWLEARGTDHYYTGDVVLTNGLLMLTVALNGSVQLWGWNANTAVWTLGGTIQTFDNPGNQGTPIAARITKVSDEEVGVDVTFIGTLQTSIMSFRLQRGQRMVRVGFSPRTYSNTAQWSVRFVPAVGGNLIAWNETAIWDQQFAGNALPATGVYPYGAAMRPGQGSWPFIVTFLYQGRVTAEKPTWQPASAGTAIDLGDTSGPLQFQTRFYAIGLTPFQTPNGTLNLQAEAESGALGTGWSSIADGAASAGNTAKCASGTASGNADLFGTAFSPPGGWYSLAVRARVTSAVGAVNEMTFGWWDVTSGSFMAQGPFKANQLLTTYTWVLVGPFFTASFDSQRFRAVSAATLGTDWFIDQAVLIPLTTFGTLDWPQDLAQQFLFEKTTRYPVV